MRNRAGRSSLIIVLAGVFCVLTPSARLAGAGEDAQAEHSGKLTSTLLDEASQAYQRGEYAGAIARYETVIGRGIRNGYLYYNMGNAYHRLGQTGKAIQHYLIAQLYLPRDGNIDANLDYARKNVQDQVGQWETSWLERIMFWHDQFSDFELTWIAVILASVFWILLALRWYRPRSSFLWLVGLAAGGAILAGGTVLEHEWRYERSPVGVILGEEVSVRSGTDINSVSLFILHEGVEVRTREEAGKWTRIELPDGKKGWVESEFVGRVRPG